jgi:hypothetical protein
MGEGWSDTMADWLEQTPTVGDYILGEARLHQSWLPFFGWLADLS